MKRKKIVICKADLQKDIINNEVFDREIALCKRLSKENAGKCCWGTCAHCGVIPLLIKLHKGELIEKIEELNKVRNEIVK